MDTSYMDPQLYLTSTETSTSRLSLWELETSLNTILHGKIHRNQSYIVDNKITSKLRKELLPPPQFRPGLSSVNLNNLGIFAVQRVDTGQNLGPYPGKLASIEEYNSKKRQDKISNQVWEIFGPSGVTHYKIPTKDTQNWLTLVQCARNEKEQNVVAVQTENIITFQTTKIISQNEELLVWYDWRINLYMGIPTHCSSFINSQNKNMSNVEDIKPGVEFGHPKCLLCLRSFNSRSNLRSHMRTHTLQRPFVCNFCPKRFSQSSTLRNHTRLHTGDKPYSCSECRNSYSQLAGLRAHQKSAAHKNKTNSFIT